MAFIRTNTRIAPYPSTGWTPADLTAEDGAIVAWWKADAGCFDAQSGGSACDSGDIIYRWEDQSGRGMHLITTTSGSVSTGYRPRWLSPPYGLPFVRWNSYAAYGSTSTAVSQSMGAFMYRDDCDFLNGKTGAFIITVMRIKPLSFGNNFGTLNVLHGKPDLGSNYDHLSRIRADFSFRGPYTDTGGGVYSLYQSRRYIWMKTSPADDSVPSPYAHTFSPNSFNVCTTGSHSDQHDRRCWFLHGSAFDCGSGLARHWHNGRLIYNTTLVSGGLNGGAYPSENANRICMNDGHWSNYGQSIAAPIDIAEMVVLDRYPRARVRVLLEGYLARRYGISASLFDDPIVGSTYEPKPRKSWHPFGGARPATLPKPPSWTPLAISSCRGLYDPDFGGARFALGTRMNSLTDLAGVADPWQGNWYQGVIINTGDEPNGRITGACRRTVNGNTANISNFDIGAANQMHGATGVTVAAILKPGNTTQDHVWFEWASTTVPAWVTSLFKLSGGSLYMQAAGWHNADTTSGTTGSSTLSTSDWHLCLWHFDYANGARRVRHNGLQIGETTGLATGSLPSSGGDSVISIFANRSNNTGSASGFFGEFCWFNTALSTTDMEKVEGYLAWRWGLDNRLPKGHPYTDGPPT
ncbi:MAG: hypothetical protein ACO3LA_07980 [Ilumatobacteraceae bacterium]